MIDDQKEIKTIRLKLATSFAASNSVMDKVIENWGTVNTLLATLTEAGGYLEACKDYGILSGETADMLLKERTAETKRVIRELKNEDINSQ